MRSNHHPALPFSEPLPGLFFITLRLAGALPDSFDQHSGLQYYAWQQKTGSDPNRSVSLHQVRKRLFKRFDEALDISAGQQELPDLNSMAERINKDLEQLESTQFCLLSSAILPNHIHLLLRLDTPEQQVPEPADFDQIEFGPLRHFISNLLRRLEKMVKTGIENAGQIPLNGQFQIYKTKNTPASDDQFWHPRSFDFRIRDKSEYENILHYLRRQMLAVSQ